MQSLKTGFIDKMIVSSRASLAKNNARTGSKSFESLITGNLQANKSSSAGKADEAQGAKAKAAGASGQKNVITEDTQTRRSNSSSRAEEASQNTDDINSANQPVNKSGNKISEEKETVSEAQGDKSAASGLYPMQDIIDAIKSSIQQKLGISEDDIEKALNTLGLTPFSLLDVNNLKQFLLQVSNNDDMSAFLTNEDLGNRLKELMSVMDTVQAQFAISKEQLSTLMQQATVNTDSADNAVKSQATALDGENLTDGGPDNEIEVTVVKSVKEPSGKAPEENKSGNQRTEQGMSASELLIQNLAVNSGGNEAVFTDQLAKTQQIREITSQILEAVKINIKPEQTSMELQLNPENLGKINLTVISKDGILTAKFVTGTEAAKEAIESQLQMFKENLNNQGLKVENVEVTVSYSAFEQKNPNFGEGNGQDSQGKQKNRVFKGLEDINENLSDKTGEELKDFDALGTGTSSVNYTA